MGLRSRNSGAGDSSILRVLHNHVANPVRQFVKLKEVQATLSATGQALLSQPTLQAKILGGALVVGALLLKDREC